MSEVINSKLGSYIRKINQRFSELKTGERLEVFGVTNKEGVVNTGVPPSDDLSNYIVVGENQFAYNPYRVNVGSIGLTPNGFKGLVSPAYVVFETNEELDPEYLFLYLKSERGINLVNHYGNRGGVRDALRYDALREIDFPFVDPTTQKAIVSRLQSFQSLHREADDILARLQANVKRLRQSILQEAIQGKLVDYKPAPGEKTGAELLADIRAEKERRAREAGKKPDKPLPPVTPEEMPFEVPEGWVWCRLGDLAEISSGTTPSTNIPEYYKNGNVQWVSSSQTGLEYIYEGEKQITEQAVIDFNLKIYPVHSLIMALYGQGKTRGQVSELLIDATINQNSVAICFYLNIKHLRQFVKYYLKDNYFKLRQDAYGGAMPHLNAGIVRNLVLALPPVSTQQKILSILETRLAQCDQLDQQLAALQTKTEHLWKSELQQTFKFENAG